MMLGDTAAHRDAETRPRCDDLEDLVARQVELALKVVPTLPSGHDWVCRGNLCRAIPQRLVKAEARRAALKTDVREEPFGNERDEGLQTFSGARLSPSSAGAVLSLPNVPAGAECVVDVAVSELDRDPHRQW